MKISDSMLGVIVFGLLLFGSSFFYPQMAGNKEEKWTEADAEEFQELGRRAHSLDYEFAAQRSRDPKAQPSPEFVRIADSYKQKEQELREAQDSGKFTAKVLFICGIALVLIGGVGYLAANGGGED